MQKRRRFIQWLGDDVDTVKVYSCPNDQYVLHWLEQQKQYICVRCGHTYDPKTTVKKPKQVEEEQVLQVAGYGDKGRAPFMVQNKEQVRDRALANIQKHHQKFGDHEDSEFIKSRPGLRIKETYVRSSSDVINARD